ncbi:MAG: PKD domain-containing protein [Aureispira sp.]
MRNILFLLLLCLAQKGWSQLQANFSSDATEICVPSLIQLSDSSTVTGTTIVQWEWTNNGVVFSTLPNPALYLNTSGTYDICLRIMDALGNRDTLCRSNYFTAFNGPTVNYNLLPTTGCSPILVNFTDLTQLGDAPIQQWRWDFGDGALDTLQASPSHLYTTVGNFDVTLVVIDTNGCQDDQLQSNVVTVYPQVTANIALSSYQAQCGLPATLGLTGIGNASGLNYNWDLGDNNLASGQNISHTYTSAGCFSPTLTVSNAWCSTTVTVPSCITVSDLPTAAFTLSDSIQCAVPFAVQFTNQSTNASNYAWDFGDSSFASTLNPNHTYNSISAADTVTYLHGLIPVVLTASNIVGCVARDTQYIRGSLQQVGINRNNLPCAPDTAFYSILARNRSSYVGPISYQWTLDNAAFITGPNAAAYYPDSGLYNVSVVVTDQLGCVSTSSIVADIGRIPYIDSFTTDTNYICRIDNIDFLAYGDSFADYWAWDFSDNSVNFGMGITHTFQDTGFITGALIASFRGCFDTMRLDTYYIYPPVAAFSIKDTCSTLTTEFIDQSIGAHRWFWDFGDTTVTTDTSSLQHPNYTYPSIGTYAVKLTVYNDSTNCVDTFISVVILSLPVANFEVPDSICTVSQITPMNTSSDAVSFFWQAAGATPFSTVISEPTLEYSQAGIYTLTLSAFSSDGCFDTLQKNIYVAGIDTNISHAPIPACRPALVNFTDRSRGVLSPIVGWQWGTGSTLPTTSQVYAFPGPQQMPLQVTNDWGCTFDLVDSFPVGGIFLNYVTNRDVCLGNTNSFTAITSSPANSNTFGPFLYIWDFGDGTRDTTNRITVQHLYTNAGVYDVCLDVLDSIGCITTLCRTDWVTVHDPTALFTADTFFSSCPPLEVNFANLSASGTIWNWSFGDGSVSSLQNPSHIYSTSGFYDVILAVEAFPGCAAIDTILQMIQITGPTGQFRSPLGSQCAPYAIELTANGTNIAGYTWLFGNGDFQIHSGGVTDTAFYTYTQAGRFAPTVVLDDGMGCQISIEGDTIEIMPSPVASFRAEPLICGIDSVQYLLDTFSSTWDALYWSFPQGQPNSSTQLSPWVNYNSTLNAQAQLIVVDGLCTDTLIQTNTITLQPPPQAAFDVIYVDSCAPSTIQFIDRSTTIGPDSIRVWQWDFGNGQMGTQADTSFVYDSARSYQIQLIVSDRNDCKDTTIQNIQLYRAPTVNANAPTTACLGDTIPLQVTSTGTINWQSTAWLSDSSSNSPLTQINGSQTYIVIATNNFGCQTIDSITVQPLPYLQASAMDSSHLCLGDSLILQANSNGLPLRWRSNATLSCTTCPTPIATPNQNSWYFVQVDSNTCTREDSVLVTVSPLPIPIIVADSSVCEGDSLFLQATGGALYQWSSNGTLLSNTNAQLSVLPIVNTIYTLQAQDSFGCSASTSHPIQIRSSALSPLPDFTICRGDSVTLQLSNGSNPTWQGQALSCQTCAIAIATPTDSTWYQVQYNNVDNCPVVDSLQIQVIDVRFFQTLPVDSICIGDSVQLQIQGVNAPILWSPSTTLSDPTATQTWAFPTVNTWYTVNLTAGSCALTDSVWVALRTPTTIQTSDVSYCIGDSMQLLAHGNATTYTWSPASNLSNPLTANPWVNILNNQQYQVVGTGFCNTDTAFANVQVQALPNLEVDSIQMVTIGQTVTLTANSNAADIWWSPSEELSCDNCWQTDWIVNDTKTFYVTALDDQGCLVIDSILLRLQRDCVPDLVYVPNAFSPDGDGQNDVLYAQTGSVQTLLGFQIYNRWGELVFESRDFNRGWDGRYKGQALAPDVFGYVLQFECPQSGQPILKKGNITILR